MNFIHDKNTNNNLIISLTSHPKRVEKVHLAIESLLKQTIIADKVILWLGEDKFPNKEQDLPKELLNLREKGLTIEWCKDIGSYTKLIPALKKYPNSIIVTVDDDIIYEKDRLEKLYYTHLIYPKDIICHRAHPLKYNENNKINLYSDMSSSICEQPLYHHFLTGVGMVLYPPKCFYKDIFREDIFLKLAKNNDDVWFWAMSILNKRKIRIPYNNYKYLNYIKNSQKDGLWLSINKEGEGSNAFDRIIKKYPKITKILLEEKTNNLVLQVQEQNIQNKCAVSIIVPVYNMSKYLNRCLDSLINQTLKEIEIICINDGSTDNSLEILNEYAKKDNRITIINQENKKLPTARNVGIKKANGEYIGFVDADDYIDLDYYEKLYNKAKKDNADIVRAPYYRVYPNGEKKPDPINEVIQIKAEKNEFLKFNEHSFVVCNAIYNTDFIKRYNILFDIEDLKSEDIMFTAKCQLFSQKIKSINNAFFYYMQDNPYSEKSINLLKIKSANIIYLKLVKLLNLSRLKKRFYNKEFKRAIRRLDIVYRKGLGVKDFTRKEKAKYLKFFCETAKLYKKEYGRFEDLYPYDSIFQYIYDGDIHSYKNIVYNRKKSFIEKYIFSTYMEYRKKDKHRVINILGIKIRYKKSKM